MLLALMFLATAPADWVPMRWISPDPKSLELLQDTPVNCLLLEKPDWKPEFIAAAHKRNLAVLGVIREKSAVPPELDGIVVEGDFDMPATGKQTIIRLPSRASMRFDQRPIIGTTQGVWPGVRAEEEGKAHAAPSGAPWIDTNGGFLRFVRAAAPGATVWLGNLPPPKTVITPERYMQAISDSGIVGARWIIALDDDFRQRLLSRDANAVRDWKKIAAQAAWFESHNEWRSLKPLSQLALLQDTDSGALYSGGVLDMIATKHTPVRPVPTHSLKPESMQGITMAVTVDPGSLTDEQKAALLRVRRGGGSTLTGPATWKFPATTAEHITLNDDDVKTLDQIWKEMNAMTGRRNLGARLFNVSSMLSNLLETADGKGAVLHLVNYSGFPVENVTVHLLSKYKKATILAPGAAPRTLQIYENEDGSGVDIDTIGVMATVVFE